MVLQGTEEESFQQHCNRDFIFMARGRVRGKSFTGDTVRNWLNAYVQTATEASSSRPRLTKHRHLLVDSCETAQLTRHLFYSSLERFLEMSAIVPRKTGFAAAAYAANEIPLIPAVHDKLPFVTQVASLHNKPCVQDSSIYIKVCL